jgi:protein tyrosine phosphatase (PTP) superfamily phosphohydrolase (DUF442 family)
VTQALQGILNYLPISEEFGTAGQPTREQFAAIRAAGYVAVVNLAMPDSPNALADEQDLVTGQGMDYVHIPVVWEHPAQEDLARFFATLDRYQGQRVFVHCVLNMRVSVFVMLHGVLRRGIPLEQAMAEVYRIWEPDPVWQEFIAASLDSHSQAVTMRSTGLPSAEVDTP